MEFRIHSMFYLLIISSLLCIQARATGSGSVFFFDSSSHPYLRSQSSDDVVENDSMSLPEVGAAVSVLLGLAPSSALSATGSSKLDKVLLPNPFDRPRSVFMLEVRGVEESHLKVYPDSMFLSGALKRKVDLGSTKADIQLSDEDVISVVSLNEPSSLASDEDITDKDISEFASLLGGSYVTDASKPLNGEVTIPLASSASLSLHMSEKADKEFTCSLVSFIRNIKSAMETHEDLSQSRRSPAELLTGCFDGFKYGPEGFNQQRVELLLSMFSKIFESLQKAYKGQIVGIMLLSQTLLESEKMLNVMFTSRPSHRWLAENKSSLNTTIAEVVLVRWTLAWLTGIILLIATLLGIYFLMNMPLTRDTLLYSNVKLD